MENGWRKKQVPLPLVRYRQSIYADSRRACKITSFPQKGWCLSKPGTTFPLKMGVTQLGGSGRAHETPFFSHRHIWITIFPFIKWGSCSRWSGDFFFPQFSRSPISQLAHSPLSLCLCDRIGSDLTPLLNGNHKWKNIYVWRLTPPPWPRDEISEQPRSRPMTEDLQESMQSSASRAATDPA